MGQPAWVDARSALADISDEFHLTTRLAHASDDGLGSFRREAAQALSRPGDYVLVNYDRKALGQAGPGHISPLGAYDAKTDRFLILDVSSYK